MPACPRAEVHTHSLPMARELLRHRLHGRIFPLLTACFGDEADVVQPDDLFVYDSLVIWYDAGPRVRVRVRVRVRIRVRIRVRPTYPEVITIQMCVCTPR